MRHLQGGGRNCRNAINTYLDYWQKLKLPVRAALRLPRRVTEDRGVERTASPLSDAPDGPDQGCELKGHDSL